MIDLRLGDCLEILPTLASGSVDAIITDLPYGTTACEWDSVIPLEPMWEQTKRILTPRGVFVTTATQPFTSALVMSNLKWFRYEWMWDKVNKYTDFINASRRPMRRHENILVFSPGGHTFNPQKEPCKRYLTRKSKSKYVDHLHSKTDVINYGNPKVDRNPCTVLEIPANMTSGVLHPTQKPLALYEYLIQTYTNPGDTVMDFCMGSGTTGEACHLLGRHFIGIEKDPTYFEIAKRRIEQAQRQPPLFVPAAQQMPLEIG